MKNGKVGDVSQTKVPPPPPAFKQPKTNWLSIAIVDLVSFLCGVNFSLFLTSVYPYLRQMNSALISNDTCEQSFWVSPSFYSLVVAAFSVFRGLCSPLFGWWSDKIKSVRIPMVFSCCVIMSGNVTYILAELCTNWAGNEWVAPMIVLLARCLMGVGAGIVALTRTYAATATTRADAPTAIALTMAANVFGVAFGPGFNVIFSFMKGKSIRLFAQVNLDIYTVPAMAGMVMMLGALTLVIFVFEEKYAGLASATGPMTADAAALRRKREQYTVLPNYDKGAIVVIFAVWFAGSFSVTNIEAMLSPLAKVMYDFTDDETDVWTSMMLMGSALVSAGVFLVYSFTRVRTLDSRYSIVCGMTVLIAFHVFSYPFGFYPTPICSQPLNSTANCSVESMEPALLRWQVPQDTNVTSTGCSNSTQIRGCNNEYNWCNDMPQVPLPILLVALCVFFSVGLVQTAAPVGVLLARIIGPRPQGVLQGMFAQVNSLARVVAPLIMLFLFQHFGPRVALIFEGSLCVMAMGLTFLFYPRLVPLKLPTQLKIGEKLSYGEGNKLYKM